jgi:hypothetical protein
MKQLHFKTVQLSATVLVSLFILGLLTWESFHGGVVTHHILQRKDLPGISNWWGLLSLPLLGWICFQRIQKRWQQEKQTENNQAKAIRHCIFGFSGALVFGIVLSIAFLGGHNVFLNYQVDSLLLLFLLVPIYRSEYILGFVLGMTVTFGAIIPTVLAFVVASVSALVYLIIRPLLVRLFAWIFAKKK